MFISSSKDRLPNLSWRKIVTGFIFSVTLFIVIWDAAWISLGFSLQPKDNADLWSYHRRRASLAGENAVVFTGSSRAKAGFDLEEVRRLTGKTPFQLAFLGRSPLPVLKNVAEDESFKGTVVVEITEYVLHTDINQDTPYSIERWIREYNENKHELDYFLPVKSRAQSLIIFPEIGYTTSEFFNNIFTGKLFDKNFLRSVVSARPPRMTFERSSQGYLDEVSPDIIEQRRQTSINGIKQAIAKKTPDKTDFLKTVQIIEDEVRRIQTRGGKVILVNMPLNGEIKDLNDKYFPKSDFWDELVKRSSAKTIYYADHPDLANIQTVDGTHFSGQNATLFTRELFKIISDKSR